VSHLPPSSRPPARDGDPPGDRGEGDLEGNSKGRRPEGAPGISRRTLLSGAAGALGGAFLGGALPLLPHTARRAPDRETHTAEAQELQEAPDLSAYPGRPPSPIGERAPGEAPRRLVRQNFPSSSSRSPLQDLHGIVTPSDLHFERHHSGVPEIDPDDYTLLVHGMVERPTLFTLPDLKRFPPRSRLYFIECSGNGGAGYSASPRREVTPQQLDGLTSTSEWTGVPLRTLLEEAGVRSGARWFRAEGMDASHHARSIPLEKAWDDAMIAYGQNGEAIRPEQGYPARLLLPGFEGSSQVKWVRRIEVGEAPWLTMEETSEYTDPLPDATARIFSLVMDAKSVITFPSYPDRLHEPGWWPVTGLAWSGRGRITGVEVSADGGGSWHEAELEEPVLPRCHTRFRLMWEWGGGRATLVSRATDETGYVQPTYAELAAVRGPSTRYHWNNLRAWTVEEDGRVFFGGTG